MKIAKLYFDTSIFNFAVAEDVPREKNITLKLLKEVKSGKYEVFISEVVIREINIPAKYEDDALHISSGISE